MPQPYFPKFNRRQFLLTASATLAAGCGARQEHALRQPLPAQPNLIVWLADSLRADHLPCYGYPLDTAPNITRFSADALLFEQCYASATWTTPATLALLTGLPPTVHRTVVPEWSTLGQERGAQHQVLPEGIPSTAALLQAAGYTTAHFQANPNATQEHGLTKGFNHYYYKLGVGHEEHTNAFLEWLQTEAREPFYAFVHLIDPHEPYGPDPGVFQVLHGHSIEDQLARLPRREANRLATYHQQSWRGLFLGNSRPGPELLSDFSADASAYLAALYDAEIRGLDAQFGRLLEALEERGLHERTAIAVTSDHGEAFGEDGLFYHGSGYHDPQIHIPLILKLPGMTQGARCGQTVGQCDIHPTLLALAGAPVDGTYGSVLINRKGTILPDESRPVLTSLDLTRPDPAEWLYRLTAGNLRVESSYEPGTCIVYHHGARSDGMQVKLEDVRSLGDTATREAVEFFHTERHYLNTLAKSYPAPGWWAAKTPDDTALKALGYL
jgi:arylsulfatase A-like enzyme